MGRQTDSPEARFLRSAKLCRIRDLEQLIILGELIKRLNELIHALQRERGTSAIVLGSNGAQFVDQLAIRIEECRKLEQVVRERLEQVDQKLDGVNPAARLYTRVALAFRALDALAGIREQVASLTMAPQDAVKAFTEIIGNLLGVGFEVADFPADPQVSRALIALVNFSQGKEHAGQERAITGAALSCGRFHATDQRRLRHLVAAQEQACAICVEFVDPAHITALREVLTGADSTEVKRIRKLIGDGSRRGDSVGVTADAWYQLTTRRIDAMKTMEDRQASDLARLCTVKLAEVRDSPDALADSTDGIGTTATVAMLLTGVDPALKPRPMRSILDVIQALSRQIHDVSSQLESARAALTERKVIERAKGLLMNNRRLSEKDAYASMRETAMSQNKRIFEIAEAILSMAEMLKR